MEDQEDVSVINSCLSEDSFEIRSPEVEPLNQSNFSVTESIEVVNTEDSILINTEDSIIVNTEDSIIVNTEDSITVNTEDSVICIEEDEGWIELQPDNDIPLNLSSSSLPVTIPFTSGDLESSSINHSNDDDDFCIVFEKKASPSEVQILENYISPNTEAKKKHRKSQNPRPSNQSEYPNSATEYTDLSLDDSVLIVEGNTFVPVATPPESQNYVLNRLQQIASESAEKKKRKIECGVCFDGPDEIEASDRSLVSTNCGHIFCSNCIKLAIKNCKQCPQCRKRLTMKQFHPLYI